MTWMKTFPFRRALQRDRGGGTWRAQRASFWRLIFKLGVGWGVGGGGRGIIQTEERHQAREGKRDALHK